MIGSSRKEVSNLMDSMVMRDLETADDEKKRAEINT
jgi:hypothetical protein